LDPHTFFVSEGGGDGVAGRERERGKREKEEREGRERRKREKEEREGRKRRKKEKEETDYFFIPFGDLFSFL
jgi:hypothetical protein